MYGHDALSYMYDTALLLPLGSQDEQHLKQIRMFKWMLQEPQLKQLEEWTRSKIISSKDKIMNRQKALKDIEKQALMDKKRNESGDQTQIVAPPLEKLAMTPNSKMMMMLMHVRRSTMKMRVVMTAMILEYFASLEPRLFEHSST